MNSECELISELIGFLGDTLNRHEGTRCNAMRFALIVWCDCCDRPLYIGGNECDKARAAAMTKHASELVAFDCEPAGHA